ncbi:hypothetical protein A2688_02165 [Candidatus Daviesbacteria bacterium RIFCSPHIGHO2_01_FULL_38_8]|nr:MAG: hypothetical protein A2688_02165 [Candidatus Daviesbacteria bacterium RIFCSPHIGHO2_01_FULL_38_8]
MTNFSAQLHDETTFYKAFIKDLENSREEVYIGSPFITTERMKILILAFKELVNRNIIVYVLTREPLEHDGEMAVQAENEIRYFEEIGVQVFFAKNDRKKKFHRKIVIIDRKILYEGSLNVLSQAHSKEFMRRIESERIIQELLTFLNIKSFLK